MTNNTSMKSRNFVSLLLFPCLALAFPSGAEDRLAKSAAASPQPDAVAVESAGNPSLASQMRKATSAGRIPTRVNLLPPVDQGIPDPPVGTMAAPGPVSGTTVN